jgi:hypothetical protein
MVREYGCLLECIVSVSHDPKRVYHLASLGLDYIDLIKKKTKRYR